MFYFNFDYESSERYDAAKYMEATEGTLDILTSYFINEFLDLPSVGVFQISSELYRPDLISYKIYGHVQYWWLLLLYNGLASPWEVTVGKTLAYPSLEKVEDLYFALKAKQLEESE